MRVADNETLLCSIDPRTDVEKIGNDTYFQEPIDIDQTFSLDPGGKSVMMTVMHGRRDIWMLEGFHHASHANH